MKAQRGIALSGLLLWGVVLGLVAILAIRAMPDVIEYSRIRQAVKAVAADANGKTVAELRNAFGKYAEVEHIKTIAGSDLDIYKEDDQVILAFAYEKRIHLVGNVSLLIDFQGSSRGRGQ